MSRNSNNTLLAEILLRALLDSTVDVFTLLVVHLRYAMGRIRGAGRPIVLTFRTKATSSKAKEARGGGSWICFVFFLPVLGAVLAAVLGGAAEVHCGWGPQPWLHPDWNAASAGVTSPLLVRGCEALSSSGAHVAFARGTESVVAWADAGRSYADRAMVDFRDVGVSAVAKARSAYATHFDASSESQVDLPIPTDIVEGSEDWFIKDKSSEEVLAHDKAAELRSIIDATRTVVEKAKAELDDLKLGAIQSSDEMMVEVSSSGEFLVESGEISAQASSEDGDEDEDEPETPPLNFEFPAGDKGTVDDGEPDADSDISPEFLAGVMPSLESLEIGSSNLPPRPTESKSVNEMVEDVEVTIADEIVQVEHSKTATGENKGYLSYEASLVLDAVKPELPIEDKLHQVEAAEDGSTLQDLSGSVGEKISVHEPAEQDTWVAGIPLPDPDNLHQEEPRADLSEPEETLQEQLAIPDDADVLPTESSVGQPTASSMWGFSSSLWSKAKASLTATVSLSPEELKRDADILDPSVADGLQSEDMDSQRPPDDVLDGDANGSEQYALESLGSDNVETDEPEVPDPDSSDVESIDTNNGGFSLLRIEATGTTLENSLGAAGDYVQDGEAFDYPRYRRVGGVGEERFMYRSASGRWSITTSEEKVGVFLFGYETYVKLFDDTALPIVSLAGE